MNLTAKHLELMGVPATSIAQYLAPLKRAFAFAEITTPKRAAAFIAQAVAESAGLSRFEENLRYKSPERIAAVFPSRVTTFEEAKLLVGNPEALANRVYANRLGNGSEASGDGWRFRGRGIFQLTGRANYEAAAEALGKPYDTQPELVAQPEGACLTAAWFWKSRELNKEADAGQLDVITRKVNGPAMLASQHRQGTYIHAVSVFSKDVEGLV